MKIRFLNILLIVLGIIGVSLLILSVWFAVSVKVDGLEDVLFKFNLLTFLTGLSYILFIIVILKLVKKE